jgi:shikimate dehydrogenase
MKRYGLLGRTLKHSYSPIIHKALGGGYSYELFEVEPEYLETFLKQDDFRGINVTIPYKQAVILFCKTLSQTAEDIGSVNTVLRNSDGSLHGNNTDAQGFLEMLKQSAIEVRGKKTLVLGSGGSSLAVCYALREQKAGEIVVISRSGTDNYENLDRHSDAQIIVNTTPLGMYPNTDNCPVELDAFQDLEGVLDIIYNPARTRLIAQAKELGIPHIGGLPMLVGQAAAAARIFLEDKNFAIDAKSVESTQNLLRRQMENIILIGMPGSGKSTIGKILRERTGRTLIDTDSEIEQESKMSIPEIFEREGEAGFRIRETEILKKWGKESGLIIATGGGVVTKEENFRHLNQNGMTFFLERQPTTLERQGRPLSKGNLDEMYKQRIPMYQCFADYTIQNEHEPEITASKILEVLNETLGD